MENVLNQWTQAAEDSFGSNNGTTGERGQSFLLTLYRLRSEEAYLDWNDEQARAKTCGVPGCNSEARVNV